MPQTSVGLGLLLIAVGLVGYFGAAAPHFTALIPAVFGILFALLGAVALYQPAWRKHAMHAAAALALLAFLGTFQGLLSLPALLRGEEVARPGAAVARSATAVLTLVFLVLAVNSFVAARRRAAQEP